MELSRNFALYEFTRSQWASRNGVYNDPSDDAVANLRSLCIHVLQPVRDRFGVVNINSGFRSPAVNAGIGGAPGSQHTLGEAADIEVFGVSNLHLARWMKDNVPFDQIILEYHEPDVGPNTGWVHVSYKRIGQNRSEVLTKNHGQPYRKGLPSATRPII